MAKSTNYQDTNLQHLLATKTLVIAEKPSVARAIASAMYKYGQTDGYKQEGYIVQGNFVISWCIGHLITPLTPDHYSAELKSWKLETLPFYPQPWRFSVQDADYVKKQFNILAKLIMNATNIINAGDPDREGQLLVDELFDYLGIDSQVLNNVKRVMISDLTPEGINKAFSQIKPNSEFKNLYLSALSRQQADWLLGMNLSRAVTILAGKASFQGVLSIGRVFTPLLAMVYNRDMEIENFIPHDYYSLFAKVICPTNPSYQVTLNGQNVADKSIVVKYNLLNTLQARQPQQFGKKRPTIEDLLNCSDFNSYIDDNGQIISADYIRYVMKQCQGASGTVTKFDQKESQEQPPLGFALSDLQQAMFNIFTVSVNETLEIVQKLYEQGLVTYPRTDCCYLNDEDYNDRFKVINHLSQQAQVIPGLNRITQFNPNQKSRIWNSKKVENHSAIIPTAKPANFTSLSKREQQAYQLIAQRYLAQFMPPATYLNFELNVEFVGEDSLAYVFSAKTKALTDLGWKIISASAEMINKLKQQTVQDDESNNVDSNGNVLTSEQAQQAQSKKALTKMISNQAVKGLMIGDVVEQTDYAVETSQTTPPAYFNDATLLSAMTNIGRYVKSNELKKILNDTDGLGTEATRAAIIEKLYKYNYCTKKNNKYIVTTDIGRGLIRSLPEQLTIPDTTAIWEKSLSLIAKGQEPTSTFMQNIKQGIEQILAQISANPQQCFAPLKGLSSSYNNSNSSYKKSNYSKSKYSKSNYSKSSNSNSNYTKSKYSKGSKSTASSSAKSNYEPF